MDSLPNELTGLERWLSKSGSLDAYAEELNRYSEHATPEEAAELYAYLRDHGERWESEWRPQFLDIFPQAESHLPEESDVESWPQILASRIEDGDLADVISFLDSIDVTSSNLDPEAEYRLASDYGCADRLDRIPFDFYPLEKTEDAISPVLLARQLGKEDIAKYLEDLLARLAAEFREAWAEGRKIVMAKGE